MRRTHQSQAMATGKSPLGRNMRQQNTTTSTCSSIPPSFSPRPRSQSAFSHAPPRGAQIDRSIVPWTQVWQTAAPRSCARLR